MKKINLLWLWDRLDNIGGVETLLLNMAKYLDRSRFNLYMGIFKTGHVASYFKYFKETLKVIKIQMKDKFILELF